MSMRKNTNGKQDAIILKTLDELVPKNHIVRKMERHLDLSFVYGEVSRYWSEKFGPSGVFQNPVDPLYVRYQVNP